MADVSEISWNGEVPTFVVVGHPNKGKSSVVAALAQDDSVRIEPRSGTTTRSTSYLIEVDGQPVYRLVDTPGFQRPRRALAWMRERAATAAERPGAVQAFVDEHRASGEMADECALLAPLLEGGLVVYVVDGSVPYGPDYEDEMEILRWTGRPGLGLINPIRNREHVETWQTALRQFLGVVCEFDPVQADFAAQLEVLRRFGAVADASGERVGRALELIKAARERAHDRAAMAVASWVATALTARVEKLLEKDGIATAHEPALREAYQQKLIEGESRARREVERIYRHGRLERREAALEVGSEDLFAVDRWYLWGLDRRQMLTTLATAGAGAGAAGGVAVDVGLGGASLAAGAFFGAVAGGASGLLAGVRYSDRLARMKLGPLTLAGRRAVYGPSVHPNLPFVVLGRALAHQREVARWSHARRQVMALDDRGDEAIWRLPAFDAVRSELEKAFRRVRKSDGDHGSVERLSGAIRPLLTLTDAE
ncbi:DUF3482 domain-containing protein [Mucisphaera sp.]|uniref:DUF3482 domain-containing protein n=1 Tax=Mucisphaera sp. TaxID=2913024 RepID=UPI003D0F45D7